MRGATDVRFIGPPGWRHLPPVTRATIVLAAAGYLLGVFWPRFLDLVVLDATVLKTLQLWRLVAHPLATVGILAILFELLLLWFIEPELEARWGRGRILGFIAAAVLVSAAIGLAVSLALPRAVGTFFGLASLTTAFIVAWAMLNPSGETLFFAFLPMPRWGFAAIAVVFVVFGTIEQTRSLPLLAHALGGLPVAWWFTRGSRRGGMSLRPPRLFRRSRLRVVRGEDFPYH